jgi:NADH:ubiquinone oxidoreductase subunit 5 (subunit L)/multisubunit Na+/H+ antiporter MnhA subunit
MSQLGIAMQGLTTSSIDGLLSGVFLLLSRSVAVLLAGSALAAAPRALARDTGSNPSPVRWQSLTVLIAFAVGVLAMAGMPPLGGFLGRKQIYAALQAKEPYLLLAWWSASAGIVLGLVRTGWSLWHAKVQPPSVHLRDVPLLLVLCLLLLCLWMGYHSQAVVNVISDLSRDLLPLFPL